MELQYSENKRTHANHLWKKCTRPERISAIERNLKQPTLTEMVILSKALEIPPECVFEVVDDQDKKKSKKLLKTLGEKVKVVGTQEELDAMVSKGVPEAIWLAWEILLLKGMDDKVVKAINETKKVFQGAILHI